MKSKKSLQESTNQASECHSSHHIYNSLLRMRAIHELKMGPHKNGDKRFHDQVL